MISLLIVIVNWNSGDQLKACLKALEKADKPCRVFVCVLDNASSDGSANLRDTSFEGLDLHIIHSSKNHGFAQGCNLGAQWYQHNHGQPDYILFLNPDTEVDQTALTQALKPSIVGRSEVGIWGAQLHDGAGIAKSCSYFPNALNFSFKLTGLLKIFKKWPWAQHHMLGFDHQMAREVDQVMGAFLLIRGHLFQEIGGFDSRFFVYFEEVDLCLQAKQAGYKVCFEPSAKVYHSGAGTTESVKGFRQYLSVSARLRYFWKNRPWYEAAYISVLSFTIEPLIRFARLIVLGRFAELWDLVKGYSLFVRQGIK